MAQDKLDVRLGELKGPWLAHCAAHNVKPGPAIRAAVARVLAAGKVHRIHAVEPVHESKKRIEVKLTASERQGAEERAKAEGFATTNLWIAALVRSALTNMPQFGADEIAALGKSNQELLAIGRNLNQIAKHLNAANGDLTEYDTELVQNLAAAVRKHVAKVGDVLRASIYRWKLRQ